MAEPIPQVDGNPKPCKACDAMVTLGLLTGVCQGLDNPAGRAVCTGLIEPLEKGHIDARDAMVKVLVELGPDGLNSTLDRMNLLIMDATARAKEELIKAGKLNPDGSPV